MVLTNEQVVLLERAKKASFGQLRQQHLTDQEKKDCVVLVARGLMKDVVGTTFMLTNAGHSC
ncbi:hypothetical protein [Azonexus hydrophilus]|uniref:DUF4224 domain-containing protein n=1 Tax=Azonexus hydrophilus TaxID=418702 RepID=A0ABZ2XPR8_9RHOO